MAFQPIMFEKSKRVQGYVDTLIHKHSEDDSNRYDTEDFAL